MPDVRAHEPGTAPAATDEGAFIPLCIPHIHGHELAYVRECLETNWVSSAGPYVDRLESDMARLTNTAQGVATQSGTASLHIALHLAGIGPKDAVLLNTMTFIAPANTIRYVGARPVFIDAHPDTWQLDPEAVRAYIRDECDKGPEGLIDTATKRHVKAIMPIHILGHPCDMDPLTEIAQEHGLTMIEDATESLGATYKQRPVGSMSDMACFSFNGNKIVTSGGGGAIVTNNDEHAERARYLTTQAKDDAVEYIHNEIGYNYRLTNVQAAIACAQLERIDEHVAAKRQIARRYAEGLGDIPGIQTMTAADHADPTYWIYTIRIDTDAFGLDRKQTMERLLAARIQTRPLWQPMHESPAHSDAGPHAPCPVADQLRATALSLPCSVGLSDEDQQRVIDTIRNLAPNA